MPDVIGEHAQAYAAGVCGHGKPVITLFRSDGDAIATVHLDESNIDQFISDIREVVAHANAISASDGVGHA